MDSEIHFTTTIFPLPHLAGNYLEISNAIVQKLGGKFNIRLICTINNSLTFQTGLIALGGGTAYVSLNAARMKKLGVKVGDTILYGKYSGTELTVDGVDYLIMRESDIFAIL